MHRFRPLSGLVPTCRITVRKLMNEPMKYGSLLEKDEENLEHN